MATEAGQVDLKGFPHALPIADILTFYARFKRFGAGDARRRYPQ